MLEDLTEVIKKNIPVFTTLAVVAGGIIGAILNNIFNWKLKIKETKLKVIEKLIDRKIDAYEGVLGIVKTLRTVISADLADNSNNLIGYPSILKSKNDFEKFQIDSGSIINYYSHWLDIKITRELYFVQDYFWTLSMNIKEIDEKYYPEIGKIIKQDFLDIASTLENITLDCYQNKISKIKIRKVKGWHKYPKSKTSERMNNTELIKENEKINDFKK